MDCALRPAGRRPTGWPGLVQLFWCPSLSGGLDESRAMTVLRNLVFSPPGRRRRYFLAIEEEYYQIAIMYLQVHN